MDSGYIYQTLNLMYSSDAFDYFAAQPSRTGRNGLDFLRLNKGSNTFIYVSSLTSAVLDEEFTRQLAVSHLYDDGLFIIGAYTKKTGGEQNSAVKYYAFNANDLHLDLGSSTHSEIIDNHVFVYPNPSAGKVNFSFNLLFVSTRPTPSCLSRTAAFALPE